MSSTEDPVSAHLSRVASLLAGNVHSTTQLAELRTAISAAISNYTTAQVKHGYLESMLEAAATVWVRVKPTSIYCFAKLFRQRK